MKTITIDYDEYKQIIKDKERAEATTEELLKHAATVIIRTSVIKRMSRDGGLVIALDKQEYKTITTKNIAKGEAIEALEDHIKLLISSNEALSKKLDQITIETEILKEPTPHQKRGWWS
tara:strand:- start:71760 stop:72116 length:357 start_codon:yes stop_codon:yes gene_type:complete